MDKYLNFKKLLITSQKNCCLWTKDSMSVMSLNVMKNSMTPREKGTLQGAVIVQDLYL